MTGRSTVTPDFRSDTVSRRTAAHVGDDHDRDDPAVNALQIAAAKRFGKEAA